MFHVCVAGTARGFGGDMRGKGGRRAVWRGGEGVETVVARRGEA